MSLLKTITSCLLLAIPVVALCKLPPPTPAQQQAAAATKAKAQVQADKDKQALAASMDAIAARWRSRAATEGWKAHAPVPIPAPIAALTQPATQASPSGQQGGVMGPAAKTAPVSSEKSGTAAPGQNVNKAPAGKPQR